MSTLVPVALLWADVRRRGAPAVALSHFWQLTLYWWASFPLKAVLIVLVGVELQGIKIFTADTVLWGLLYGFGSWLAVYAGWATYRAREAPSVPVESDRPSRRRVAFAFGVGVAALFLFLALSAVNGELFASIADQNEKRTGAGGFFLLAELYLSIGIAILGWLVTRRRAAAAVTRAWWLVAVFPIVMGPAMSIVMASRRFISLPVVALLTALTLRNPRRWWVLLTAASIGSVCAAPILQILRYGALANALNLDAYEAVADPRFVLTIVSSTFEGVDHMAVLLAKGDWLHLAIGYDGGLAWLFNAGLSLVPRAVWTAKPELYGLIYEQFVLYPWMYESGPAQTTLPPSFVVDYVFGLGLAGGLVLSAVTGRCLAFMERAWRLADASPVVVAISLYAYVTMFNLVRGGTSQISNVLLFAVIAAAVVGAAGIGRFVRGMLRALRPV